MSLKFNGGNSPIQVLIDPGNSPPAPPSITSITLDVESGNLKFGFSNETDVQVPGIKEIYSALLDASVAGLQPLTLNDEMMSAYYAARPTTDPDVAGTVFANAGILTISSAGPGTPTPVLGGLTTPAANVWLDGLPSADPLIAGRWFDNAGVPTLSSAGPGDVSGYAGPVMTDQLWCLWVLGHPVAVPDDGIPGNLSKFWLQSAGIALRTA
ncbi:hypothetical protein [Gluconobacter sp.]|uniref:hypothetical protein n=1 Tax=Gluconobacter sp. TaxID=1876758 RepID=UPI0039E78B76